MKSAMMGGNFVALIETALMHGKRTNILPYHTLRLVFEDPNVDPRTIVNTFRSDLVWTKVDTCVYDLYCESTDWSNLLNGMFYNENHMKKPQDTVYFRIIQAGDTSDVTTLERAFRRCSGLKSICLLNTKNVVSFYGTFCNALSLKTVPLFDTSSATTMRDMFNASTTATHYEDTMSLESVPLFNTSKVINTHSMFQACASLRSVPLFDLSNVEDAAAMFIGCTSLKTIPKYNLHNATNVGSLLSAYMPTNRVDAAGLDLMNIEYVPDIDISNATSTNSMFAGCYKLRNAPMLNTSNVTTMSQMFFLCSSLETVPLYDTRKAESLSNMFSMTYGKARPQYNRYNNSLKHIPSFSLPKVINLSFLVQGCTALCELPQIETGTATTFTEMFCTYGYSFDENPYPLNTTVTEIPAYDFSNASGSMQEAFAGLSKVSSGMLYAYNQLKSNTKITNYKNMFKYCGIDKDGNYASDTAKAERAQIPKSWGGDMEE